MAISLTHTTVAVGTDAGNGEIAKAQWNENHTLTMATARLLGRTTAGDGAVEEISVGTGLSLSGGSLTNTVTATSPGGSNTQLQFNNSGSFGGASGLTTNGTELTIASGTKTTSAPVLDATQTWNAGGVTFTGMKLNVTDTASASGSLLMDLQVGGSSKFSVSKAGNVTLPSAALLLRSNGIVFADAGQNNFNINVNGATNSGLNTVFQYVHVSSVFKVASGISIAWTSGDGNGITDLFLARRAAANLRLGAADAAAPVAQTLSVQSVVAGTTNTAGANLTITGSQGTGTGAGGSIIFQVAPAGSSGTAQNALATALTIAASKVITVADTYDLAFSTSTGTKIGTATTQKLAFYNATPVVQPTAVADATDAASVITQLNALLSRMRTLGLIAT